MFRTLLSLTGALVMSGQAMAADLAARPYTKAPPPAVALYDWTGFYLGANGGYGSSRECFDSVGFVGAPTAPIPDNCGNVKGWLAGGQAGYRWQTSAWVLGVEAQGDWANLTGSAPSTLVAGVTSAVKIDGVGLLTAQIGYAWNNVLVYVKGGAAVTSNKYTTLVGGAVFSSASETRWGGTVGTGIEFGFAPNWSVSLEYDHLFMGSRDITFPDPAAPVALFPVERIHQDTDLGFVKVNYRFGGPVVAKY